SSLYSSAHPRHLHSFPTRRSSDLQQPALRVASPATAAVAQRASIAPRIDGREDDAVWQTARAISDFRQFEPRIGADPSFRTEFRDRKSTRLNSSHVKISYAVFCLK